MQLFNQISSIMKKTFKKQNYKFSQLKLVYIE